jgi:protein gp37
MTDLFGEWVTDEMVDRVFAVMALCPQITFQVLTKRARRMREYWRNPVDLRPRWVKALFDTRIFPGDPRRAALGNPSRAAVAEGITKGWRSLQLPNVWLGVSAEDQPRADERIPDLLQTPAAVRFVSYEPALGPVNLSRWLHAKTKTSRREGISSSGERRIDDSGRWNDLEARKQKSRPLEWRNSEIGAHATPSGEVVRAISPGSHDDKRQAVEHDSPPACMAVFLRTDTGGSHSESQEWDQDRQSNREPGISDEFGTAEACDSISRLGCGKEPTLSWVIIGGESGPRARPFRIEWAKEVLKQCRAAHVPAFMKQLGAQPIGETEADLVWLTGIKSPKGEDPEEWPEYLRIRQFPESLGVDAAPRGRASLV